MSDFSKRCLLRDPCKAAGTDTCNATCPHYVALHGYSGDGGRIFNASVPKDYRLVTLATSPARQDQAAAYRRIERYIKTFTRQFDAEAERIKSMYLFSREPGTGKTTTAAAILNAYLITHYIGHLRRGQRPAERPVYFFDVNEWQALYNRFNRPGVPADIAEPASREYYRREQYAINAEFAVFDDIGVRECTEGFRGDLHAVINARVTEQRPTVYTSNIPLTSLADVYDVRLADRIRDMCVHVDFVGESKRGMR